MFSLYFGFKILWLNAAASFRQALICLHSSIFSGHYAFRNSHHECLPIFLKHYQVYRWQVTCKCKVVLLIRFRAGVYSVIMDINWVISYTASWCLKIILRQCLNYLPSVELNNFIIAWLMIKSLKWILYFSPLQYPIILETHSM